MEKRYQVFVSSTYEDLKEERQEVMHALLELDCMPAGMELFPAANEDQWSLIKGVIDDCDYYWVVIAGRYGSVDSEGMSYTEKENRYALEQQRPIIAFLHKDPDSLPARKAEKTPDARERLQHFRELAEKKMCKHWTTPAELGSVVSRNVVNLIKRNPATGWVRADLLPDKDAATEILDLRRKVEALQRELDAARTTPPPGSEELARGDDEFRITCEFQTYERQSGYARWSNKFSATWDEIFSAVAPLMISETGEPELHRKLDDFARERSMGALIKRWPNATKFRVEEDDFNTIKVQLRALGLVTESIRKRSLKDSKTYWTLTPYGDAQMVRLRAIK